MTLVSVKAASKLVARSEQMLRKLIAEGKLKSRLENGRHYLDPNEVTQLYQQRGAARSGAVAKPETSSGEGSAQIALLERQIVMLQSELDFTRGLLTEERTGKRKLEEDMTAVLREIRAYMEAGSNGVVGGITRFFRK
jgi:hypothetical protein